jgi:putative FmdB family regulatory protein
MPIYEYACSNCGHRLETLQKFSDAPLKDCPECAEPTLQKLISPAAFHLKGTGWYATDFRDKGKREGHRQDDGETKTTESRPDKPEKKTKSEDKPAAA